MVTTRTATPADAAALARLAEQTFRDTFATYNSAADMNRHCEANFQAEVQRREILDPGTVTLLAELDDEMVGFAQVFVRSAKACVPAERPSELYRLYVSSQFHGQGVAQKIMQEVFTVAAEASSDWIWLGVWEDNPRAVVFYQKLGFKAVGEHTFMLGADAQRDTIMAVQIAG